MKKRLLNRLEQIEYLGRETCNTVRSINANSGPPDEYSPVNEAKAISFKLASLSFIEKIYGRDHPYYEGFNSSVEFDTFMEIQAGLEILKSIRQEIEGGWLISFKDLVTAELFSDFLEMASHLLDQQYKDAAAVIIGSVLEGHLRQLCASNSISVETQNSKGKTIFKTADRLNSDLAKNGIYSKLDFEKRNRVAGFA